MGNWYFEKIKWGSYTVTSFLSKWSFLQKRYWDALVCNKVSSKTIFFFTKLCFAKYFLVSKSFLWQLILASFSNKISFKKRRKIIQSCRRPVYMSGFFYQFKISKMCEVCYPLFCVFFCLKITLAFWRFKNIRLYSNFDLNEKIQIIFDKFCTNFLCWSKLLVCKLFLF